MNSLICNAIANKNIIEFYYKGGIRLVEPHCYGIQKNSGNDVLCGTKLVATVCLGVYQIGGFI